MFVFESPRSVVHSVSYYAGHGRCSSVLILDITGVTTDIGHALTKLSLVGKSSAEPVIPPSRQGAVQEPAAAFLGAVYTALIQCLAHGTQSVYICGVTQITKGETGCYGNMRSGGRQSEVMKVQLLEWWALHVDGGRGADGAEPDCC